MFGFRSSSSSLFSSPPYFFPQWEKEERLDKGDIDNSNS